MTVVGFLVAALAGLGWGYYSVIVFCFWNFVSYLLLGLVIMVLPILLMSFSYPKPQRAAVFSRRMTASGVLLGLITLMMFLNVARMPQQVYRHYYAPSTMITPEDPLIQELKDEFYSTGIYLINFAPPLLLSFLFLPRVSEFMRSNTISAVLPKAEFQEMSFQEQMSLVDVFIYDVVDWKEDYSQYKMVGLLTTPNEVLTRKAGDCQGQSATTTSLLLALDQGFEAWMVETPFHWWTHARNPRTGEEINLNVHGNSGKYGNVLPQPIDLVYTRWPAECKDCDELDKYNREDILYVAPPHEAFAKAWIGAHEIVRSLLPAINAAPWLLVVLGTGLGVAVTVYATYIQEDISLSISGLQRFFYRLAVAAALSIAPLFCGIYFWGVFHYQFSLLHVLGLVTFTLSYVSLDSFNACIGTPATLSRLRRRERILNFLQRT